MISQTCCTSVSSKDLKRLRSVSAVSQCPINCLPLKWLRSQVFGCTGSPSSGCSLAGEAAPPMKWMCHLPGKGVLKGLLAAAPEGRCGARIPSCPNLDELEELCWSLCGYSGCKSQFWPTLVFFPISHKKPLWDKAGDAASVNLVVNAPCFCQDVNFVTKLSTTRWGQLPNRST